MEATDVISLASAADWLSVDDTDTNVAAHVTRLISTAIEWVETYTCHLLFQRPVVIPILGGYPNPVNNFPPLSNAGWRSNGIRHTQKGTSVYIFPFIITSVEDPEGNTVVYQTNLNSLKTIFFAPYGTLLTLNAGYAENPPSALIDACYKMITYLYENRDMYSVGLPTDVQMLCNQYRRAVI